MADAEQEHAGDVRLSIEDGMAVVIFDRPHARNAMTWSMYEALARICERLHKDASVRVVCFRGAGGAAFVAGTDIEQFRAFRSGDDGIAYEQVVNQRIAQIENLPMPTVAIIEGWAMGGGMAIASACDFRIATPDARFGIPIARTLGNCISMANTARLVAALGVPRVKRLLLLAETLGAEELLAAGYLLEIVEAAELDAATARLTQKLAGHAPLTMRASKEAIARLTQAGLPDGQDLIHSCYGSEDFRIGIQAFLDKQRPEWTGR